MASQNEDYGQSTPEYLAFRKFYPQLVATVAEQPNDICDALFAKCLVPESTRNSTRHQGTLDQDKARKLVDTVIDRIKRDTTVFYCFIGILQTPSTKDVARLLQEWCETEQKQQLQQSVPETETDEDLCSEESFHSAASDLDDLDFECPFCEKCSYQRFYSKEGCPERTKSMKSKALFPYINVKGLSEADIVELEDRLITETSEIIDKFYDFSVTILKSLEMKNIDKVKELILGLVHGDTDVQEKIVAAQNLSKVFSTLRDSRHISFINFHIIEKLIAHHGSEDDQKLLMDYLSTYKTFSKRNVFQIPSLNKMLAHCSKTAKVLTLKCSDEMLTLEGVESIRCKVAQEFRLQSSNLQLCSVRKGCIEIRFIVSSSVADKIFPVSRAQYLALNDLGLRILTCEVDDSKRKTRTTHEESLAVQTRPAKEDWMPVSAWEDNNTATGHGQVLVDIGADLSSRKYDDDKGTGTEKQKPTTEGTDSERQVQPAGMNTDIPTVRSLLSGPYSPTKASTQSNTAVASEKFWKGRDKLRVFFMDSVVDGEVKKDYMCIDDWTSRGHPLNINTIMAWARVWNLPIFPEIPYFEMTKRISKADIRVQFSETGGNWSMVGINAKTVTDKTKPTMMLNLQGHSAELMESLVIHTFGKALGLEHEHQRSDFWDVMEKYLNVEMMKRDPFVNPLMEEGGGVAFERDWYKKPASVGAQHGAASVYDPTSIMHFWFDIQWLNRVTLWISSNIDKEIDNKTDKTYLKGLHKRFKSSGRGGLCKRPSMMDYRRLMEAYGGKTASPQLDALKTGPSVVTQDRNEGLLSVNEHLSGVVSAVHECASKWGPLGTHLQLSYKTLGDIDHAMQNERNKLEAVIKQWMSSGKATIHQLCSALQSMGRKDLADVIRAMVCSSSPADLSPSPTSLSPSTEPGVAVAGDKVWKGQDKLMVYFMDSVVDGEVKQDYMCIEHWKCRGHHMSVNTVMAWARVWNLPMFPGIPCFEVTERISKADIRVQFSETGGNWSMVGINAKAVTDKTKPTMMLNLKGHSAELMESLVIHTFGKALGLEHEHQRSDFWDVMEKYLNVEMMKRDLFVNPSMADDGGIAFERDWYKKPASVGAQHGTASVYDPTSIMHFWFDIKWLQDARLQNVDKIDTMVQDTKEQEILKGLHVRYVFTRKGELPQKPSMVDYRRLVEAYGGTSKFVFSSQHNVLKSEAFYIPIIQDPNEGLLSVNEHLSGVVSAVRECASKWGPLGTHLQLSYKTLGDIDHAIQNERDKLEAVIKQWMSSGKATIYQLLTALKAPEVEGEDVADDIRVKVGL